MNDAPFAFRNAQTQRRTLKILCAARSDTPANLRGTHREITDVLRLESNQDELILQSLPGIVEGLDFVIACHQHSLPRDVGRLRLRRQNKNRSEEDAKHVGVRIDLFGVGENSRKGNFEIGRRKLPNPKS